MATIEDVLEADVSRQHPTRSASLSALEEIESSDLTGIKVLVVDDEPDARLLIQRLLKDCNASVVTAGSASEALQMLLLETPDVLVSDIGMPGEDGYMLMRRIRLMADSNSPHPGDCLDSLCTHRRSREGHPGGISIASLQACRVNRARRDGAKSGETGLPGWRESQRGTARGKKLRARFSKLSATDPPMPIYDGQ